MAFVCVALLTRILQEGSGLGLYTEFNDTVIEEVMSPVHIDRQCPIIFEQLNIYRVFFSGAVSFFNPIADVLFFYK